MEIASAPAGDVKILIVNREIDIGNERRARVESLQHRRQQMGIGGLGRDLDDLFGFPAAAVAVPSPDRGRQILQAQHAVDEAVGLGRIVRRAQLEDELMLRSEIDFFARWLRRWRSQKCSL
jgi:hypothetical protein